MTRVVFPEREMAVRIAHSLVIPNVLDYIELSGDFSIVEVPAPPEFFGKTLRDIGLRARFGLTTIAIKRRQGRARASFTTVSPGPDDVVRGRHPGAARQQRAAGAARADAQVDQGPRTEHGLGCLTHAA